MATMFVKLNEGDTAYVTRGRGFVSISLPDGKVMFDAPSADIDSHFTARVLSLLRATVKALEGTGPDFFAVTPPVDAGDPALEDIKARLDKY